MAARIRNNGASSSSSASGVGSGLLPAPAQGANTASTSIAIVPYQAPQNQGYGGDNERYGNGSYNGGNRSYNTGSGGGYNNGSRYPRNWSNNNRDREHDERFEQIYGLLSEQAEEREQRKREAAGLVSLEEEKKRLQAEEEKRVEERKEREQQEARLGLIVRTNVKTVSESALGRKVELPGEEESKISKMRKELEALKSNCASTSNESNLEVLRKEKEALLRAQGLSSEEDRLRREIDELKAQSTQRTMGSQQEKDEVLALKIQIEELGAIKKALEDKSSEVTSLKKENLHLRHDFNDLKEEFMLLRNAGKRGAEAVTEKSPPEAPSRGKHRVDANVSAMYTPKDMDGLYKAYKEALAGKEMALREAGCLKERMAKAEASKIRLSIRKFVAARKTTPRNLKTTLESVEIDSDDEKEDEENRGKNGKGCTVPDTAHELEVTKLQGFRDKRLKELRSGKKNDFEKICEEEGITYVKLDQAKNDVAEIRARRDFDEWVASRTAREDDEQDQHYSTSVEETNDD
ncbi:hypothetical protein CBR_g40743 [Chara braunii]|uniref:Uncharacterized protein n=1 Tax=Chara braunii TaxID=69332 RepID=A0A388LUD5_CHABU|nr:hypothetical protein CBR_g40743 [Chara braunii]|eukprot:GBG85930.1 hypothetical protein CBR_g40743 [Chara braunii]